MHSTSVAIVILAFAAGAQAGELAKLDRTIRKQPAYVNQPRYCLLAFGIDARSKVWLVLDGETLYVDFNGSGDLTEPGKKIAMTRRREKPQAAVAQMHNYLAPVPAGGITIGDRQGQKRDAWFFLEHYVPQHSFTAKTTDDAELKALLSKHVIRVGYLIDGQYGQTAQAVLADRLADASILHFDGPRTLSLTRGATIRPVRERLELRAGDNDLVVNLTTPGWGEGSRTVWDNSYVPADKYPVADVQIPGQATRRVAIAERCCGERFHRSVTLPIELQSGTARITLALPGWREGRVAPATIDIPIAPR